MPEKETAWLFLTLRDRNIPLGIKEEKMNEQFYTMITFENLYEAHKKSRSGKREKYEVIQFELNLSENLVQLQKELYNGTYRLSGYRRFEIYDPKPRTIYAMHYRDRIVQHSLCDNVIAPCIERHLIYDNSASRVGKGTHFAMNRLTGFLREYYKKYGNKGWFLKYDVHHYYDSINHQILKQLMRKAFPEEPRIIHLLEHIIDSYSVTQGVGIPLGNQTSSWFASCYLDGLDRLIKERLQVKYYSRYMDDGVLIHQDKEYLKECLSQMEKHITEERRLEFNEKTQIIPLSQGIDYLGFHFYLTDTGKVIRKLRSSNKGRMKRKLKRFRHAYREGKMDREAIERSLASYRGHLSHGNTWNLRKNLNSHLILSKETEEERKKAYQDLFHKNKPKGESEENL